MAVTHQSATVLVSYKLDRTNFPSRSPREEFYLVNSRHVQAAAGDADSDVVLYAFPRGTIGVNTLKLFRGAYGSNGLVSLGVGAHTSLAGESVDVDVNTFVDATAATAAALHSFNASFSSLTGVNLLLTFTTAAASTLPDLTVHDLFLIYSVVPPPGV